jgi:hypothetical protein
MIRRSTLVAAAALVVAATLAGAAEILRVTPLVRESEVLVTFELADGFNDEVRQAIASGLRTSFTYDVELRMIVPAWVDRTIAAATVTISDQFDNLTRQHTLSRSVDGRVVEALVTEDEAIVKQWLTTLKALPLCATTKLDSGRDYYVRISARARPSPSMFGWTNAAIGRANFTFVP